MEIIGEVAKGSSETTVGKNLTEVNLRENERRGIGDFSFKDFFLYRGADK